MTDQAVNLENLLKGNSISKKEEALGYARESVLKKLAQKHEIEWTNKSSVIVALALAIK